MWKAPDRTADTYLTLGPVAQAGGLLAAGPLGHHISLGRRTGAAGRDGFVMDTNHCQMMEAAVERCGDTIPWRRKGQERVVTPVLARRATHPTFDEQFCDRHVSDPVGFLTS